MKRKDIKTNEDPTESKLILDLKADPKLIEDPEKRMEYVSMATMFLEDFSNNIYKTSIEMYDVIPYFSIDMWREFLNYPVVRKYIKAFKDEQISAVAERGMAEGDKNALGIKKAMEGNISGANNSNIVLIRLPERKDEWLE
ncbi:MAG: hypothetical protein J6A15_00040 [Clostridia bacterium]|nr:hypothetical protein [Clostridia bacterium]